MWFSFVSFSSEIVKLHFIVGKYVRFMVIFYFNIALFILSKLPNFHSESKTILHAIIEGLIFSEIDMSLNCEAYNRLLFLFVIVVV